MKKLVLDIDGRLVEGTAAYDKGTLWVHLNGQTYTVDIAQRRTTRGSKAGSAAAHFGEIGAPMPGKVIKINGQAGDEVAENQVLVVMEAMKMEYTLKAPIKSRITEILCEPGQQVALGQILMKLDKA